MRPSDALELHRAAIREIVSGHRAERPAVFGSVLTGKDVEGSDLDLLVHPCQGMSLFDVGAIKHELQLLLDVKVDVHTPGSLPERWAAEILATAKPV